MANYRGNFQPKLIQNCILWLDADGNVEECFVLNGSNVAQWKDKSSNNNHALQSTSINQPVYISNGLNSKGTLQFNDFTTYMDLTNRLQNTGDTTCFFVFYNSRTFVGGDLPPDIFMAVDTNIGTIPYGDIRFGSSAGSVPNETISFGSITPTWRGDYITGTLTNNKHLLTFRLDGTNSRVRLDNVEKSVGKWSGGLVASNSDFQNLRRIGKNRDAFTDYFVGLISEILFYSRALDDSEINQIENYLSNKWGIS